MSKSRKVKADAFAEALSLAYQAEELEDFSAPPPPRGKPSGGGNDWQPDLNSTQRKIFDDPAEFILAYGEKGRGKTIGVAHKGVRHCYENDNALWWIITPAMRAGSEGIWHDLGTLVLPQWGEGIGLEYTDSKLDPNTKDRHRWIRNRFGGWSKVLLTSAPHASLVQDRIKGPAPSMLTVEELTNCNGREYFTFPASQLGRRPGIAGPQQYTATCNPAGPSHWVYKVFWEECKLENGERDPNFSVYHVPISENAHRLPPGYVDRLKRTWRADPIEWKRLIDGEWIDRPSGEGLFNGYFVEAIHIKGDLIRRQGLRPHRGFPIIIGYDLGQVYSSATFMQLVATKERPVWIVFDEVDHLNERILYKKMAWEIVDRLRFWNKTMDYEFRVVHITDESAINQWRPGGEGSYDAWEFEREYNRVSDRPVKMLGCPKGPGSVAARIRMLQGKLHQEEIYVSATCPNTRDMLLNLESEKDDPDRPRRCKWLHKFDSLTYPMFKMEVVWGGKNYLPTVQTVPSIIQCGKQ